MTKTERILAAARDRFEHYGVAKTTMQEIATDAGVAVGTLYLYFRNKDELIVACAREFVDDRDARPPRDDRRGVHFLERDAAVFDAAARHDLEAADQRRRFRASVRLDESDDDVDTAAPKVVRFLQHSERFAHTGRGADVDLQAAARALL